MKHPMRFAFLAKESARIMGTPRKFKPHGKCGMELSDLLPHIGSIADDICLIRSMRTAVNNHGQSIWAMTTGRILQGRPSLGSWMAYGLGTENRNLPAFVVLTDPTGLPVCGAVQADKARDPTLPSNELMTRWHESEGKPL